MLLCCDPTRSWPFVMLCKQTILSFCYITIISAGNYLLLIILPAMNEGTHLFIRDITALQTHADDRVQHALHKGNTTHFSGFNCINIQDVEDVAHRYGKKITYLFSINNQAPATFRASDDIDSPVVEPMSLTHFLTGNNIVADVSPSGGATQQFVFTCGSLSSQWARNLLAHPQTLNILIENNQVIVLTITPSQIVNGLSDRASRGQMRHRQACPRPTYCGKSRKLRLQSFRSTLASALLRQQTVAAHLPATLR